MNANTALINTVFILFCILTVGLLMELVQTLLVKFFGNLLGPEKAYTFVNKTTFLGVVHHELSHALFVILTGAKITKMNLFKPDKQTKSLGSVEYSTRGMIIVRSIQYTLISVAPTVCGAISSFLIYKYGFNDVMWRNILFGFILVCIVLHMNMSSQDIKVAIKGVPVCLMITFIVFYWSGFDLFERVVKIFA